MKHYKKILVIGLAVMITSTVSIVNGLFPVNAAVEERNSEVLSISGGTGKHTRFYYDNTTKQISILAGDFTGALSENYYVYMYHLNEDGKAELDHKYHFNDYANTEKNYYLDEQPCQWSDLVDTYENFENGKTKLEVENNNSDFWGDFDCIESFTETHTNLQKHSVTVGSQIELSNHVVLNHDDIRDETVKLIWESTQPKIASVSENGTVTGIKDGSCIVRARLEGTELFSAEYQIFVEKENEDS